MTSPSKSKRSTLTPISFRVRCQHKLHTITFTPRGRITIPHARSELQALKALGVTCGCDQARQRLIQISQETIRSNNKNWVRNYGLTYSIYKRLVNDYPLSFADQHRRYHDTGFEIPSPSERWRRWANHAWPAEGTVINPPANVELKMSLARSFLMARLPQGLYKGCIPYHVTKKSLTYYKLMGYPAVRGPHTHYRNGFKEGWAYFLLSHQPQEFDVLLPPEGGIRPLHPKSGDYSDPEPSHS